MKKQKLDESDSALDAKIKQQNKEYYELHDQIANQLNKPMQLEILKANHQAIPEGIKEVRWIINP